jgi:hypothetical protein
MLAIGAVLPRTKLTNAIQAVDEHLLSAVVARRRIGWRRPTTLLTSLVEPPPPSWPGSPR